VLICDCSDWLVRSKQVTRIHISNFWMDSETTKEYHKKILASNDPAERLLLKNILEKEAENLTRIAIAEAESKARIAEAESKARIAEAHAKQTKKSLGIRGLFYLINFEQLFSWPRNLSEQSSCSSAHTSQNPIKMLSKTEHLDGPQPASSLLPSNTPLAWQDCSSLSAKHSTNMHLKTKPTVRHRQVSNSSQVNNSSSS
jgi:hypothetical protein